MNSPGLPKRSGDSRGGTPLLCWEPLHQLGQRRYLQLFRVSLLLLLPQWHCVARSQQLRKISCQCADKPSAWLGVSVAIGRGGWLAAPWMRTAYRCSTCCSRTRAAIRGGNEPPPPLPPSFVTSATAAPGSAKKTRPCFVFRSSVTPHLRQPGPRELMQRCVGMRE